MKVIFNTKDHGIIVAERSRMTLKSLGRAQFYISTEEQSALKKKGKQALKFEAEIENDGRFNGPNGERFRVLWPLRNGPWIAILERIETVEVMRVATEPEPQTDK